MNKVLIELSDESTVELEKALQSKNLSDSLKSDIDKAVLNGKILHKGHWVAKPRDIGIGKDYFCSECGKMALSPSYWECDLELSDFCPHCGIEMLHDHIFKA